MIYSLREGIRSRFGTDSFSLATVTSGVSGLPIYKLEVHDRRYAVRSWPHGKETIDKVALWNRAANWLDQHADELKPSFFGSPIPIPVPWSHEPTNLLLHTNDHLWTLANWMPGTPLGKKASADDERGESHLRMATQLASLHQVSRGVGATVGTAPGLVDRWNGMVAISDNGLPLSNSISTGQDTEFVSSVRRQENRWSPALRRICATPLPQHWIIRDLWRDNILVDDQGRWVSTVDVGASRVDWPVLDFLRLFGSLGCSRQEWQHAYEEYFRGSTIERLQVSPSVVEHPTLEVCFVIHWVSTAISIGFWMKRMAEVPLSGQMAKIGQSRLAELFEEFDRAQHLIR